jgi:hypothetical protein
MHCEPDVLTLRRRFSNERSPSGLRIPPRPVGSGCGVARYEYRSWAAHEQVSTDVVDDHIDGSVRFELLRYQIAVDTKAGADDLLFSRR